MLRVIVTQVHTDLQLPVSGYKCSQPAVLLPLCSCSLTVLCSLLHFNGDWNQSRSKITTVCSVAFIKVPFYCSAALTELLEQLCNKNHSVESERCFRKDRRTRTFWDSPLRSGLSWSHAFFSSCLVIVTSSTGL
uniref:Uncharacterized protein n=1 Tax=Nothobranchius korthausae TaxID=1143690 RepID=A0A1A8F262_9TELE